MSSPDVTVVIPTHNRRARLPLTLRTALYQRAVDLEIVVVDDGSSDGTSEYLARHRDPRVRFVRHDVARGLSASRNAGIETARGRWIAFLDDDDLWAPDKLQSQLAALSRVPESRWSAVGAVAVDGSLQILRCTRPPASGLLRGDFKAQNVIPGGGSGVLASTEVVREVGGFDTRFTFVEDLDLWIRLAERAPIASVDRPLVAYVVHGTNLTLIGDGYEAELRAIEGKYGGAPWVSTLGLQLAYALGKRRPADAAWMVVRASASAPGPRGVLETLKVPPRLLMKRAARWMRVAVPKSWRDEAEAWLSELEPPTRGAEPQ